MVLDQTSIIVISILSVLSFALLSSLIAVSVVLALKKTTPESTSDEGGDSGGGGGGGGSTSSSFWVVSGQAEGTANNIWYSFNGTSWTEGTGSPFGNGSLTGGNAVHYSSTADQWVSVGGGTDQQNLWKSADGIAWTTIGTYIGDFNNTGSVYDIYYANGLWHLSIGSSLSDDNYPGIYYSTNALNWFPTTGTPTPPFFGNTNARCLKVHFDNSRWVAVGNGDDSNNHIWYSDDGIDWLVGGGTPFGAGEGRDVYYSSGIWVAVGGSSVSGQNIWHSTDNAVTWIVSTGTNTFGFGSGNVVLFADGVWVAGGNDIGTSNNIVYSVDGQTNWTSVGGIFGINGNCFDIKYSSADDTWIAVGDGSASNNNIFYSSNGTSWTVASNSPFGSGQARKVAYDGSNNWVAVGNASSNNNNLWYSTNNGVNWTVNSTVFLGSGIGRDVIYTGNLWVVTGSSQSTGDGGVWYNSSSLNVEWNRSFFNENLIKFNVLSIRNIFYADNKFVVASNLDEKSVPVFFSSNVKEFTQANQSLFVLASDQGGDGRAVTYANNTWVVGGQGTYTLASSKDSNSWIISGQHNRNSESFDPFDAIIRDILYVNNTWFAVGSGVWYSINGNA